MSWIKKAETTDGLKFDVAARVEIWIDDSDLEDKKEFKEIMINGKSEEDKIKELKEIAMQIAMEKINDLESEGKGISVSHDITIDDINVDKIDWTKLMLEWMESYYYKNDTMSFEDLTKKYLEFGFEQSTANELIEHIN